MTELKTPEDIDSIRKILFGDQVAQFEDRFASIEKSIAQLRSENRNLRQALEAEMTMREKTQEEMRSWVLTELKKRDEGWDQHLATQVELLNALQQVLDQFKKTFSTHYRLEK